MDYIRNSKNRKLKTQILHFFSRLTFGTHRLGISGKSLIANNIILIFSLFFPWLRFDSLSTGESQYWPFSIYLGGIGYGICVASLLTGFFLLSHEKKEHLRAYVPFRLSDAQAIVFVTAMVLVGIVHVIISSFAYTRIASQEVTPGIGLQIATASILISLICSYFFSQSEKSRSVTLSYLEKKEPSYMDEYSDLLDATHSVGGEKQEDKNMTLPI